MTIDQFWDLVERVHHASDGDMDRKCTLLEAELLQLPVREVRDFNDHFHGCYCRAYSHSLWAAAYLIGGGCSDDSFSDFRSTLISMGQITFERALSNPESLSEIDYGSEDAYYEGYQYVPSRVERSMNGGESFPRTLQHPREPIGVPWKEEMLAQLFPRLAKKCK